MRRQYQGVTAYVGLPGSGKTYSLAEVGVRALAKGREVWANTDGSGKKAWLDGARPFATFDEFQAIPNDAVILWDELPLFVNARKWQDFPDGLLYRLTQIRKDGLELHFSTIDWRMVDINVRRITFWVWECEHAFGRTHRRVLWPPEERRKKEDRPRRRELYRISREVREAYDTFGKVLAPLGLPAGETLAARPGPEAGSPRSGVPVARTADKRPSSAERRRATLLALGDSQGA